MLANQNIRPIATRFCYTKHTWYQKIIANDSDAGIHSLDVVMGLDAPLASFGLLLLLLLLPQAIVPLSVLMPHTQIMGRSP